MWILLWYPIYFGYWVYEPDWLITLVLEHLPGHLLIQRLVTPLSEFLGLRIFFTTNQVLDILSSEILLKNIILLQIKEIPNDSKGKDNSKTNNLTNPNWLT